MPLDSRQVTEIFLTSAQSLFAVAILIDMRISIKEAGLLFLLFSGQLVLPFQAARLSFAALYLLLTLVILLLDRERLASIPKLFSTSLGRLK